MNQSSTASERLITCRWQRGEVVCRYARHWIYVTALHLPKSMDLEIDGGLLRGVGPFACRAVSNDVLCKK